MGRRSQPAGPGTKRPRCRETPRWPPPPVPSAGPATRGPCVRDGAGSVPPPASPPRTHGGAHHRRCSCPDRAHALPGDGGLARANGGTVTGRGPRARAPPQPRRNGPRREEPSPAVRDAAAPVVAVERGAALDSAVPAPSLSARSRFPVSERTRGPGQGTGPGRGPVAASGSPLTPNRDGGGGPRSGAASAVRPTRPAEHPPHSRREPKNRGGSRRRRPLLPWSAPLVPPHARLTDRIHQASGPYPPLIPRSSAIPAAGCPLSPASGTAVPTSATTPGDGPLRSPTALGPFSCAPHPAARQEVPFQPVFRHARTPCGRRTQTSLNRSSASWNFSPALPQPR